MTKRNTDFTLSTKALDDLFSTQEERDDANLERVQNIPLCELHLFKDHPFKIENNEEMQRLFEVVKGTRLELPVLVAAFYGFCRVAR